MTAGLLFRQLFEVNTCTYTYLLADMQSKECILIDPVLDTVERDAQLITELGLKLICTYETHVHADHITAAAVLKGKFGCLSAQNKKSGVSCASILLEHNQTVKFGEFNMLVLDTPGHTDSCMSYYIKGMVFTGDSLMIRSAGRTDFQNGSAETLYNSITQRLFTLPSETLVYPGHDYKGMTVSTIGEEIEHNPRIGQGKTMAEFTTIMNNLKLDLPKKISQAVPANLKCGTVV